MSASRGRRRLTQADRKVDSFLSERPSKAARREAFRAFNLDTCEMLMQKWLEGFTAFECQRNEFEQCTESQSDLTEQEHEQ